jgi:hypothetical protein
VVLPDLSVLSPDFRIIEKQIIEKELHRYEEISRNAVNNVEALKLITEKINQL